MDKMELLKPMEHRQPGWYWYGLGLAAIVLTGLALRLYSIGSESLWLDEGFGPLASNRPLGDIWLFIRAIDVHPPLYYMILHFWIGWFGDSETAMRILSAILGTLSLPLVYRLGRDLMDRKTASLAALLAAICVYHVFFGQEVRGYALFGFLALLSMVFWVRLFVQPGFGTVAGYVACTALTLYSHPYGVFHVACQNVMFVVLWLRGRPLRLGWPGWIGIQSLLGLAFSPWIVAIFRTVSMVRGGQTHLRIPSIWDIPGALKAFAGDADFIATGSGERFWLGGLFVLLMLAGLWPARWGRKSRLEETGNFQEDSPVRRQGVVLVSVWLACTVLIPYIVSVLVAPVFSNRYMMSGSFAFLLLVARGVGQVPWRPARWGVAAGVILSQVWMLVPYYTQVNKEQWRQAASFVESTAQPGDCLLFHAPYCRSCVYWYYARRDDLVYAGYPSRSNPWEVNPKTIREELLPLLKDRDRVCLILAHSFDTDGLIRKALDQEFVCTDSRQFYRVSVWFYERKVATPTPSAPDDPNAKGR
jgi:mannosyltransferase